MPAVIRLQNLTKRFSKVTAVRAVNLEVEDGEFLALLGPSGCGKTTLLRMLGGFEPPDEGRVFMDGRDITALPPNKRPLNMLFQSYAVFPHMSVRDNVAYGLRMEGAARDETARRATAALEMVRMENFAARMPDQLSGGQRQRVALARALVKKPRVLLLDEPLSALDAKLREAMQRELVKLQRAVGITFIVVTHDQDEALSMADRAAVMENGEIRQLAPPAALYESPNCRFVADFIGRINILPDSILQNPNIAHHLQGAPAAAVRPEKIHLRRAADSQAAAPDGEVEVAAEVESVSYHGDESRVFARDGGGFVWQAALANAHRDSPAPCAAGDRVQLSFHPRDVIALPD